VGAGRALSTIGGQVSSARHRKFLRIELTEQRRMHLERYQAYLSRYPDSSLLSNDLSHLAAALLDSALEDRMVRIERREFELREQAERASFVAPGAHEVKR
jgi:hypothetical protein